ncbi:unnamed protein product [Paramecium octaurelia]|uniref:Uncharacterized protein n=1 Tax=Paramecium octaurelia TaxID=43137 RepID=A0A8S1T8J2_PAROT|nr:unnamed protein product [Paramecium octaurelia]
MFVCCLRLQMLLLNFLDDVSKFEELIFKTSYHHDNLILDGS